MFGPFNFKYILTLCDVFILKTIPHKIVYNKILLSHSKCDMLCLVRMTSVSINSVSRYFQKALIQIIPMDAINMLKADKLRNPMIQVA